MVLYCVLLAGFFIGGYAFPASTDNKLDLNDDLSAFFKSDMNDNSRIVGGSVAAEGAYPWMVAIAGGFTTVYICGGALVSNRHVLTAAHCIDAIMSSGITLNLRLFVGTNRWNTGETRYSLRLLARNPAYDPITKKNDVGMIVAADNISFNDRVMPIAISFDYVPGGVLVRVSGWGWLQTGGTLSDMLQEIRLLTLDGESCAWEVRQVAQSLGIHAPRVDPDVEICTFLTGNEGICIGDGGSPLVRNSNNQLIGVASWGVPCARGAPDMFARINIHRDWIQNILSL